MSYVNMKLYYIRYECVISSRGTIMYYEWVQFPHTQRIKLVISYKL